MTVPLFRPADAVVSQYEQLGIPADFWLPLRETHQLEVSRNGNFYKPMGLIHGINPRYATPRLEAAVCALERHRKNWGVPRCVSDRNSLNALEDAVSAALDEVVEIARKMNSSANPIDNQPM